MRKIVTSLITVGIAAGVAVAVVAPSPASADRGGHRALNGTSSIKLEVLTGSDTVPNWGDQITFDVATTATDQPHVDVVCTQNGATVYSATTGYYASYPWPWTQVMTLQSQMWTGGAADCTATLYYFDGRHTPVLSTLPFTAQA
jgi:hypothetical protein